MKKEEWRNTTFVNCIVYTHKGPFGDGKGVTEQVLLLSTFNYHNTKLVKTRDGSRAAATSKMEPFVIIVNGWKPLTIITKRSILDVAAALDPPLKTECCYQPDPSVLLILGVVYWKDQDDYQKKLGMPVVIHQLVKTIFFRFW